MSFSEFRFWVEKAERRREGGDFAAALDALSSALKELKSRAASLEEGLALGSQQEEERRQPTMTPPAVAATSPTLESRE